MRILLPAFLLLSAAASAQRVPAAAPAPRPELLVSTGWLGLHLKDPGLVVLQVGRERTGYDAGHIGGARYVDFKDFVIERDGVANELPPVADLKKLFEGLGISNSSRVVIYGDTLGSSRLFYTLEYAGHRRVSLLDGGFEKWKAEKRAVSTETPEVKAGSFQPRPKPEVLVVLPQVRDLSYTAVEAPKAGVVLVDSRSPEVSQKGRIPGSKNVFWNEHFTGKESQQFKPAAELLKLYQGIPAGALIVSYCNSGVQASQSYFTLRYLGFRDVRMYDGSFGEWAKAKDAPVER